MQRVIFYLLASVLTGSLVAAESDASNEGWTNLLAPQTDSLDENWTSTGNWTLEDGVATLTPRPGEQGWSRWSAYLWTKKEYGDFVVEFDYKLQKGGNSGFYFRVGDKDDPVRQGIEVQLYASAGKPDDKLTDHDAGGIIPGIPPQTNAAAPVGEWNTMRVVNRDGKILVTLNGTTVNEVDLSEGGPLAQRPETGPLGFQDHALPISLRNIRIKPLQGEQ